MKTLKSNRTGRINYFYILYNFGNFLISNKILIINY